MERDATELDAAALKKLADNHEYAWRLHSGTQGVSKNSKEAFRYLELAAESDRPESLLTLARILMLGDQVERDVARAVRLMKKAASKGYACAQVELASAFYLQLPTGSSAKRRLSLEPIPDALAKYTRCAHCMQEAHLRCECGIVKYCDEKCHRSHWRYHKLECATIRAWTLNPLAPRVIQRGPDCGRVYRTVAGVLVALLLITLFVAVVLRIPSIRPADKKPVLVID